jgi:hypothetical protein
MISQKKGTSTPQFKKKGEAFRSPDAGGNSGDKSRRRILFVSRKPENTSPENNNPIEICSDPAMEKTNMDGDRCIGSESDNLPGMATFPVPPPV